LADNNLSKNIKIGIDVELNKRSVDEVTKQIAALSANSIKLKGSTGPVTAQDFTAKLFESFFNKASKVTPKQIIDILPTKELKKAAGEMLDVFRDVKEQLRDVGQQLKFDQNSKGTGSARFIVTPIGQGRPTKSDTYSGRTVVTADFDRLVREVKEIKGQDRYTKLGSAARGNLQIEGLRQLVLQEIEKIVGGSVGSGVKVTGLAQYIAPSQAGITRIEESEKGLVAVVNDIADDLEGLDDATRSAISELNKNAKNLAELFGIKILQARIDPRTTPENAYGDLVDPSVLQGLKTIGKGKVVGAGMQQPISSVADFIPGKDGGIAISPALLEVAFENVVAQITKGTHQAGAAIVEAKAAEAISKLGSVLDFVNAKLHDTNLENPSSGRIWGSPTSLYRPSGTIVQYPYQGPVRPGEKLPDPKFTIQQDSGMQPYSADSMRKLAKFIKENPEAYGKFQDKVFNDIMQGALDAAMAAEEQQTEQLAGGELTNPDQIQHGVNYIIDAINNAVLQYEERMGLEIGSIFHSIGSTPDPELKRKLQRYFLENVNNDAVGNLGSVLGAPFNEAVTGTVMSFDTYTQLGRADIPAQRVPYSPKELEDFNKQITAIQSSIADYRQKISELENELKTVDSESVIHQLSSIIENYVKSISDSEKRISDIEKTALAGKFIPAVGFASDQVKAEKVISTQMLSRPEFLKKAKIVTGIQDLMMQAMAEVPKQIEEAVAVTPIDAIFKKYEGLGLGAVIEKLKTVLAKSGGETDKLLAGFDTEFLNGVLTPITELSIKVQDAFGNVIDLLDFFHIPAGLSAAGKAIDPAEISRMLEKQGAGPQSIKDIAGRAAQMGFDASQLGSAGSAEGDVKANLKLYQEKIKAANAVLSLLNELGITLAGSNVVSADFSKLAQSADNLNRVAEGFELEPTRITNSLQNVVDILAILEKLQKASVKDPQLEAILTKTLSGSGLKLSEILGKIVAQFPGALQNVATQDGKVTGIGGLPPHFAAADATGSMLIHSFLRELSTQYAAMSANPGSWAGVGSYGHGGQLLPYSKDTRSKYASAFGDIQPELSFDAGARTAAATSVAASAEVVDAEEKQAVATHKAAMSIEEQTLKALEATKVYKQYVATMKSAAEAIDVINQKLKSGENVSREEKAALLKERAAIATEAYNAKVAIDKLKKEALNVTVEADYLKEIRRAPYDTLATQQLTAGGSVVRNLNRKVVTVDTPGGQKQSYAIGGGVGSSFDGAGRPPGGGYITERGGEFFGPDPKKTRDASEEIKRQLKDQVQAEKEAQAATKALVSTWISGRYALYDVGNAFQNVSQNLLRFTRSIFQFTDAYKNYETAFTSVDRAMQLLGDETQGMATMFIKLSETMPISFEQLTAIGTLGAQMGVTADGIKNFTEVVAKFSTVTGISADTTAQKFGRIAELANVDYGQFENLGSAIAYAGVNAVATESEILSLTEAIAAVSEQAGFAPEEIVGLSTAIASLGIAPEQARGVFTRVFADINRAVNTGGSSLANFAKVAGMSSSEFASTWADPDGGASKAFRAMLGGLKATGNMTKAFDSLNITETREVNTLTRLAENLNVVDSSMQDASTAFEDGAFLADSFDKTVDNLDAKIQLFQNNFKSAMQAISQSAAEGFKTLLDFGSGLLKVFKAIADDSVLGPLMNFIYGVTALGGISTGIVSVLSKVLAQIYAFRVAMVNTANDPNVVSGIGGYIKNLTGFGATLVEDHTNLTALNGSMGELKTLTYGTSDAFAKLTGDSSKLFSSLLNGKNIYLSTGEALAGARGLNFKDLGATDRTALAREEAKSVSQIVEARKRLVQTMSDQLNWSDASAVATFRAIESEQIYIYTTEQGIRAVDLDTQMALKNASAKEIEASAELKAARANIVNAEANRAGAAAINMQTKAQSVASKGALGFSGAISAMMGPIGIAIAAISLLVMGIEAIKTAIDEANTVHLFEDQGGTAALREAIYKDTQAWMQNGEAIATARSEVISTRKEVPAYKTALISAAKGQEALKESTGNTTDAIKEQTLAIGQNTKELLAKALYENEEVQAAFKQYPDIFSSIEAAGVNVSDLLEKMLDPNVSADELISQLEAIKNTMGTTDPIAFANAISVLEQAIRDAKAGIDDALSNSKLVTAIKKILGITDEVDDNVNDLGKTVRTVIDYANDLSNVFERIQQITLERLTARDTIVNGWRNIRQAAKDAQDAIKAANEEITSLTADQSMLQYQYDVAKRYGDERRMAILQGKLAAGQTKIAEATNKRNDAEDQASMSLNGSSKAAIANRASISSMVDGYQSYVLALARAGVKGKDLQDAVTKAKESFIRNGESVGFSRDQLEKYTDMFDDFLSAVKKTPRNVTVEFYAKMTAAENALREFLAKANNSKATVKLDAVFSGGTNPAANVDKNGNPILYGDPGFVKPAIQGGPTTDNWLPGPEWFKNDAGVGISPELAAKGRAWATKWSAKTLQALLKTYSTLDGFKDTRDTYGAFADAAKTGLVPNKGKRLEDQQGLLLWLQYLKSIKWDKANSPYFASGGYVTGPGSGTSDSIPAMLSNGEFVMNAKATSAYGADFMNALNQQRVTFAQPQTFAQNSNNGPTMVYLSPEDRALLRAAVDRPVELYTENTKIAQSANAGNVILAQRGAR
jgi:TP901 family phage tail tape measure protein